LLTGPKKLRAICHAEPLNTVGWVSMWFAFMRTLAKEFRVYFPRLPWCLRQEDGEATGRRHFHYLLAGLPRQVVNIAACYFQMATWEDLDGGMARVHRFDPRLNGAGYLLKRLGQSADAGDLYESAKFGGGHCHLMFSNAAERIIRRRSMRERDV